MFVLLQTKYGPQVIKTDTIYRAYQYGKYVRIELEDGTPIDVQASIEEVCTICNRSISSLSKESKS